MKSEVSNMERVILHCDCNGFYASVECVLNPALKNVPMAVGGDEESRHGIILAKNELAKKYNIKTAETIYKAKQKCKNLVVVPPHHALYAEYSKKVNAIYERYTDRIEPFGIDESWLDVTESVALFGSGKEIADKLRREVKEELGITISVGVSFNKMFAKLGSDYKKPDATTEITKENFKKILYPLPAACMMYVGKSTYAELERMGVCTIGDIALLGDERLTKKFGKAGHQLYENVIGMGDDEVRSFYEKREIKSIGKGQTFSRDLTGIEELKPYIIQLSDNIAAQMRRKKVKCRGVQITIKDPHFKVITRQKTLDKPTYLEKEIARAACRLLESSWDMTKPIRMFTVTGLGIIPEDEAAEQISFFEENTKKRQKREKLEKTIDSIRDKYGKNSVTFGKKNS